MEPLHFLIGVFLLAAGMCVGSFLNVVIWRLPNMMQGAVVTYKDKTGKLTLNWPPSHCPNCDSAIPWYLNVPVFGWFILAGQCARCRKPIALRYPIVELATGVMFLATFLAYATAKMHGSFDVDRDWPALGLHLIFISGLLAAAAIDADTYYIPLSIPVLIGALALIAAPLTNSPILPTIPTDQWQWANPIIGAGAGLLLANILLWAKMLPVSFIRQDAEEDKKQEEEKERIDPLPNTTRKLPTALTVIVGLFGISVAWLWLPAAWAAFVMISVGAVIFLVGVLGRDPDAHDATEEVMEEISAAGARKEILKEVLFLSFPVAGALIAAAIPHAVPYQPWLARLLAAAAGIIVGGGSIWAIRILGTLWKGIEAMGLGDIYLMAGVGAVLGPINVLTAFPLFSAFLAVGWAGIRFFTKGHKILPFGPWLAIGSILALFFGQPTMNWYIHTFLMNPAPVGR